ncbi:hypothetical protein FJ656_12770 [Schumannella luteola]|nr:hypothetical protein FJ656_12770 [Schumannella luteola]
MPDSFVSGLRASMSDTGPLPFVDAPLVDCVLESRCSARAATDTVAIVVDVSMRGAGVGLGDAAAFEPLAVTAMTRIAAAGGPTAPWTVPNDQVVPTIDTCSAFDPDGVIGAELGGSVLFEAAGYEDPPLLEGAALFGSAARMCVAVVSGTDRTLTVDVLPDARWAWDRLKAARVADGAAGIDLAGADAAFHETSVQKVYALRGDAIVIVEVYTTDPSDSSATAALSAWLNRYAA